jgi:hypothetical protein
MRKLAALEAEELVNLCTRCHPSWADIAANGPRGVANVRYPFYRLTNSRCYDTADTRITCAACHDAHGRLAKEALLTIRSASSITRPTRGRQNFSRVEGELHHLPYAQG